MKRSIVHFLPVLLIFTLFPGCEKVFHGTNFSEDASKYRTLLTDDELGTPEDPNAAAVNEEWGLWIKDNFYPIRSLEALVYSDLAFLEPLLEGKRFVQLGESAHGVKQFSQAKIRLIRFLHERLGYDMVAFESDIYGCFYTWENMTTDSSLERLRSALYEVWHTETVEQFFGYIQSARYSERQLIMTGFDMEGSGTAVYSRPGFFREIISTLDDQYAERVFNQDTDYINRHRDMTQAALAEYAFENKDRLTKFYQELADFFETNKDALWDVGRQPYHDVIIARQAARSQVANVLMYADMAGDGKMETYYRDNAMAENFKVLVEEMYPDKKVIIWAHNFHVRHRNQDIPFFKDTRTMGSWLAEWYRPQIYTIGLYMYRGQASRNDRVIYDISAPTPNSLEAIFYQARCKYMFVDLLGQAEKPGNSWMFHPIRAKRWGDPEITLVPRNQYDGILFIDTVEPPVYR